MKKYILLFLIVFICNSESRAQSTFYKEWFQQKSTQREYLLNQIAALKMYSAYLKQGYNIYKKGHKTIGDLTNGEFNLHHDFFQSLKEINPVIARYGRVSDIIQLQIKIIEINRKTLNQLRKEDYAPFEEIQYISSVYDKLLKDCLGLIGDLFDITTAGNLEMEDKERLERIDKIFIDMQKNYRFAETFSNDAIYLSKLRQKEKADLDFIKKLIDK